jgi:signal transduction histidine kinase
VTVPAEHARHINEISRVLAELGADFQAVLERLTAEVGERLHGAALLELIGEDGTTLEPTSVHHPDAAARAAARQLAGRSRSRVGEGLTGQVAATGRPLLVPSIDPEPLRAMLAPGIRDALERFPVSSVVSVPLTTRDGPLGVLTVWREHPAPGLEHSDLDLMRSVADHAALAISNARLYDRLRQTNAALGQHTTALEHALDELETFAWSVSHDLRAPLHSIQGFARMLGEDYRDALDDVGRDLLDRIEASAERMNELIEALLDLSRLSRHELVWGPVDVTAMCRELDASLRANHPERAVLFSADEALVARGDAALLRVALGHLLNNAWKFSAHRNPAHVQVRGDRRGGRLHLRVIDDGVGFDMAHQARLFAPFQRLHSRSDFPGTGVGLATVARIVRRHGGRVAATGVPGQGATFEVWLPD